jgi:hypothetical protein
MRFPSIRKWLCSAALTVALVTFGLPGFSALAAGTTVVKVNTPAQPVVPGQQFIVNIRVEPADPIVGAQFNLSFNPSLVSVLRITEGNLFNQNDASTFFLPGLINNTAGTILGVSGTIIGRGQTVSTSGTFAVITMIAGPSAGSCPLYLSNVIVGGANGQPVPASTVNGQVVINDVPATTTTTPSPTPPSPSGGSGGQDPTLSVRLRGFSSDAGVQLDLKGLAKKTYHLTSSDNNCALVIPAGTSLLDALNEPVPSLTVTRLISTPEPPVGHTIIVAYDFGPDNTKFKPGITLILSLEWIRLPAGTKLEELSFYRWDGNRWDILDSTVNPVAMDISTTLTHFTTYALVAAGSPVPPVKTTATTIVPNLTGTPTPGTKTVDSIPVDTTTTTSSGTVASIPTETTTPALNAAITPDVNQAGIRPPIPPRPASTNNQTGTDGPELGMPLLASFIGATLLVIGLLTFILVRRLESRW